MTQRDIIFNGIHYVYEIIENIVTIYISGNPINISGYGIKITSTNQEGKIASDQYENISPHKEKVEWLIKKFSEYNLSPYHLCEVVDEIIDDYISDFDTYASTYINIAI